MTPPDVHVRYDPSRARGLRWIARVGYVGNFGSGRTREKAIRSALRIYERDQRGEGPIDETIPYAEAYRISEFS